jgi:hypothetical protein
MPSRKPEIFSGFLRFTPFSLFFENRFFGKIKRSQAAFSGKGAEENLYLAFLAELILDR